MDALRLTLRAGLRRRWRPMLGLALLLGVIGGVVLTVIEWQAAAWVAVAQPIGAPAGLLADRWAGALSADAAGVPPVATVPVPLVLAAIPVTLALTLLIVAWPGRAAARVRPAIELRAE